MKRTMLPVVAILSLLASSAFAAPDRVMTIEKGKLKILHIQFTPTQTVNSNPDVLAAKPDAKRNRLLFDAREVGESTFTVFEGTEDGSRRLEVLVRVVDAPIVTEAKN